MAPDVTNPIRLLVTAGPTHEPIDAVRYLANRSSGRMGIALAEAAAQRGWATTLLLGPTHLLPAPGSKLTLIRFQTTSDLRDRLAKDWPHHDVLIMAAAVADYRPCGTASRGKLKRTDRSLELELEPTPDLLAELASKTRPGQTAIGFALEPPESLIASARAKLTRKHLAAIVANPLETMDSEQITATLILAGGETITAPPALAKTEFADWLLDRVTRLHDAGSSPGPGGHPAT